METEAELAKIAVAWLRDLHWEVYQEVKMSYGDKRADIVAVQNKIVWVIETKMTMSIDLLDQAYHWRYYAHRVSICYPTRKSLGSFKYKFNLKPVVYALMRQEGIGLMTAEHGGGYIHESIAPRLNRTAHADRILSCLCEEHKTFAEAGNNTSTHWSPFQDTCSKLREYLTKNPGSTLKQVIDNISTHYHSKESARGSIAHWLKCGKVKGVRVEKEGRGLKLFAEQ